MIRMSVNGHAVMIVEERWEDELVLRFRAGGYEAVVIPGIGAQIIEFRDVERGLDLVRTPNRADLAAFKGRPQVYGIPLLFPPNRIEDGKFPVEGRVLQFPVNSPTGNNHLHGFLRVRPWRVAKAAAERETVKIVLTFEGDSGTDDYAAYVSQFHFSLKYTLSRAGLEQRLEITNRGNEPLPVGIGFHTALKVPFHPESKAEDCRLRVSIGRKWELNERGLATGKLMELTPEEELFRTEGVRPQGAPISIHGTAEPIMVDGKAFHGAIIDDLAQKLRLIYRVGPQYKHWVVWNDAGNQEFICPEPQSWAINAPHIRLDPELTGYRQLKPGETWTEDCALWVESY